MDIETPRRDRPTSSQDYRYWGAETPMGSVYPLPPAHLAPKSAYIAASFHHQHLARSAKRAFEQAGLVVTARWIDDHKVETDQRILAVEAIHDLVDIELADWFVLLNTQKKGQETTGKAVEMGYALALGKGIIVVGERTNVFHSLPEIIIVDTLDEAIREVLSD